MRQGYDTGGELSKLVANAESACIDAVEHVALANYAERRMEALSGVRKAFSELNSVLDGAPIKERIEFRFRSGAKHFAIAAIALHNAIPDSEKVPLYPPGHDSPQGYMEVEFKINGMEVSFQKTMDDLYKRWEADMDRRAANIALERLRGSSLENLHTVLTQVEWQLKNELEKAFNVKFD